MNSTASVDSLVAASPGRCAAALVSVSKAGASPGTRSGNCERIVARRSSPPSQSRYCARASPSCCTSSAAVSRAFRGSTTRPASATAQNHAANRASPGISIAIGPSPAGAAASRCVAPRPARSARSAKVQDRSRHSSAIAAAPCSARNRSASPRFTTRSPGQANWKRLRHRCDRQPTRRCRSRTGRPCRVRGRHRDRPRPPRSAAHDARPPHSRTHA